MYRTIICGGGPAAWGPIVAAAQKDKLKELLSGGLLFITSSKGLCGGSLPYYRIRANSLGKAFLEVLDGPAGSTLFADVKNSPEAALLRQSSEETPPLTTVGAYLDRLGESLDAFITKQPDCRIIREALVKTVSLGERQRHAVHFLQPDVNERRLSFTTQSGGNVIIALGGCERDINILEHSWPGLVKRYEEGAFVHAKRILDTRDKFFENFKNNNKYVADLNITIIGNAHSAWSIVNLLLDDPELSGIVHISVAQRGAPKLFYMSPGQAVNDGYTFDPAIDVCPITGRVHRFGGLRGDAFQVARKALGLGGMVSSAIRCVTIPDSERSRPAVRDMLQNADLIIDATGFDAALPELLDVDGRPLQLARFSRGTPVDPHGRLLLRNGSPVQGILTFGLGSGLQVSSTVGGEPSYQGRADGVWLYQNDVGNVIVDALINDQSASQVPSDIPERSVQKTEYVKNAVILAAGLGSRLGLFTTKHPKPLVSVNKKPLLLSLLSHMASVGIENVSIVVGHFKEQIISLVGDDYEGVKIKYIVSDKYRETNNSYSLWLAREILTSGHDVLLAEADLVFDVDLLKAMCRQGSHSLVALASYKRWMNGTVMTVDKTGKITSLIEGKHQGPDFFYAGTMKTVNVYTLRADYLKEEFVPALNASIERGEVNDYYELIFSKTINDKRFILQAVNCDHYKWYEVDDYEDLDAANYIFSHYTDKLSYLRGLHGGYWRYPFKDHSLLYNLYFPPKSMLSKIKDEFDSIVLNYPVGQRALQQIVAASFGGVADNYVVANGSAELIKIIVGRLGLKVMTVVPTFNEYENATPVEKLVRFELHAPHFNLNIDDLAKAAKAENVDIIIIVSPNNPTSQPVSRDDLLFLHDQVVKSGIKLLVDESFVDFADDTDVLTLESFIENRPNLLILKSLSKTYGIGGIRLGYLLTSDLDMAESVRRELPIWNVNGFAEAWLRALPRYQKDFRKSCELVRKDRDHLYRLLKQVQGLTPIKPQANFIFVRLDGYDATVVSDIMFEKHAILVKDCSGKSMNGASNYLRLSCRTQSENLKLVSALLETLSHLETLAA